MAKRFQCPHCQHVFEASKPEWEYDRHSECPYCHKWGWNVNCLEGFECPACHANREFRIVVTSLADFTDDGSGETHDLEWEDDSFCICSTCGHEGTVDEFRQGDPARYVIAETTE